MPMVRNALPRPNRLLLEHHPGGELGLLMNWSVYVTVASGYVVAIAQASHITWPGLLLLTAANVAWLAFFHVMRTRVSTDRGLILATIAMIGCALAALGTLWLGDLFDWLLPIITVSYVANVFPPRSALLQCTLVLAATLAIFGLRYNTGSVQAGISLLPAFIFAFLFPYIVRRHAQERERAEALVAQLETAQAQLRAYASQVEELSAARERNRIAREIHDTLGHYLTILAVQLETARKLYEHGDPRLGEELTEARRAAAECLAEVRHSVAALRPADPTAHSFPEAIRRLIGEFEAVAPDTAVTLDAEGPLQEVAPELRVALYRCVQESLTNVRKHAAATKVLIRLRVDDAAAELTVLDNGTGAATSGDNGHESGFGLLGMRERIALLGGTTTARAEPGRAGWRVEVRLPLLCPITSELSDVQLGLPAPVVTAVANNAGGSR
jgi:signal transduction histidine kinase